MCDASVKVHGLAYWWLKKCLHQVGFWLVEKVTGVLPSLMPDSQTLHSL